MAVLEETPITSSTANGVTTYFPHSFTVLQEDDLVVTGALAGVTTTYTRGTDYTISGVGSAAGAVTFPVAPASGTVVTRYRDIALTRETDYQDNGDLLAQTLNADLDRIVFSLQDIFNGGKSVQNCVRAPGGEAVIALPSAAARAGYFLGFDGSGQPTLLSATAGTAAALAADLASSTDALKGAALSGFDPGLNYAVGTIGYYLSKVVSDFNVFRWIPPAEWGDILDGTSTYDSAAAWASAFTAAIASGRPATVTGPTGRYYLASVIGNFTGNDITFDGNGSTFDCAGIATGSLAYVLRFSGTYAGSAPSLTSNAAALQKTVAVNSASFAVGDMVRLYSNSVWDSTRTNTKYGELNWIETIPGGASVTLVNDTASLYTTAATAKLEKITPCKNITIRNFKIVGPAANDLLFGMRFTLCDQLIVENVKSFDFDTCHLQLVDCSNYKVTRNHFEESNSASTGYGCSVADASQDGIVGLNTFKNVRHSLSTNNDTAASWGITRRCLFEGNIITDSARTTGLTGGDAIDNHAGSEDISIIGNIIFASSGSGIISEGRTAIIKGNSIYSCQGNAITHQNYTDLVGECHISGNTIRGVVGSYGIAIVAQGAGYKSWSVNDNNVNSTARALQLIGASGKLLNKGSLCGNTLVSTTAIQAVNVEYAAHVGMSGGSIEAPSIGTLWENCSFISVSGVAVEINNPAGTTGYGHRFQGTGEGIIVAGNPLRHSGALSAAAAVSFINTTITNSRCYGNTGKGFTAGTVFNVGTGTGNVADSTNVSFA